MAVHVRYESFQWSCEESDVSPTHLFVVDPGIDFNQRKKCHIKTIGWSLVVGGSQLRLFDVLILFDFIVQVCDLLWWLEITCHLLYAIVMIFIFHLNRIGNHSYRIVEPNNDGLRRMFVYSGSNQVPCLFLWSSACPLSVVLGVWRTTIFFHTPQLIHSGFNKKNSALAWTCLKTTLWVKHPKNEENIFTIERCVYFGSVGLPSSSELAHQKLKRWTT